MVTFLCSECRMEGEGRGLKRFVACDCCGEWAYCLEIEGAGEGDAPAPVEAVDLSDPG